MDRLTEFLGEFNGVYGWRRLPNVLGPDGTIRKPQKKSKGGSNNQPGSLIFIDAMMDDSVTVNRERLFMGV